MPKTQRYSNEDEGERHDFTYMQINPEKLNSAIKKFFSKNAAIPKLNVGPLLKTLRKLCSFYGTTNDKIDIEDIKKMEKTVKVASEIWILTNEEKEILKACMNRLIEEWTLHQEAIFDIFKALMKVDGEKFDIWKFLETEHYEPPRW